MLARKRNPALGQDTAGHELEDADAARVGAEEFGEVSDHMRTLASPVELVEVASKDEVSLRWLTRQHLRRILRTHRLHPRVAHA